MNIESIYAIHKSSLTKKYANSAAILIYIFPALLCLIPYVQYIAWIFPLVLAFKETDSDLVKYAGAQASIIYFLEAFFALIVTFFAQLLQYPSTCVIDAIINFGKAPAPGVFYIIIYIIPLVLAIIACKFAKDYTSCKFKFSKEISEKIAEL